MATLTHSSWPAMSDDTLKAHVAVERTPSRCSFPFAFEQLRWLLEKLPVGAYTCDPSGLITYFNRHAAQLWGRAPRLNAVEDRFRGSLRLLRPDGTPISDDECWMALALKTGRE